MNRHSTASNAKPALALLAAIITASLTACGGGSESSQSASTDASTSGTESSTSTTVPDEVAQAAVQPTYNMAPVELDEPAQEDVGGTSASAAPKAFNVDSSLSSIDTARLTPDALTEHIASAARARAASVSSVTPSATTITGAVYTPAQIRAAYGLPDLPATGTTITPAIAATLGAGQTIYIIDAYHDASALADLNLFSTRFGLPTCTAASITTSTTLPLAAPPSSCTLSVVTSDLLTSKVSSTVPAYNSAWAPESKLDVQWAHAIAPLARIVLIESVGSSAMYMVSSVALAGKMGPGVVSMSFCSAEISWSSTYDSSFTTTGMTYLAASGDAGSQVNWPALSTNVVAVGGTSLNWSGSGTRYEAAWASTGGGISAYEALPSWQSGIKVHGTTLTKRSGPDVSFNSNPYTGQYVALTLPGATATTWRAYGGTSIATPQWAGIVAVANAIRVANSKSLLGDIHSMLYTTIGKSATTYASAFGDVVDGSNGTCATCSAAAGFDTVTGWGTPNVAKLLPLMTGVATPTTTTSTSTSTSTSTATSANTTTATAPAVPGGAFYAKTSSAMSVALNIKTSGATTYAVTGGPSGLTVDSSGKMVWASAIEGSYAFTVTATTGGATGSAGYTLKVIPQTAPTVSSSTVLSGTAGKSFATTVVATNPNTTTLSYSASGTPSGLSVDAHGVIAWTLPVAGTYSFPVTVKDAYGYTSTTTLTLKIA